jgi:hypothetical protein
MQADGNFVAVSAQNTPYWATGTAGHAGAMIVMQDDGNLVVYDAANKALWATNTVQDLLSPTIRYTESSGYAFDETSESWKQLCQAFPCFLALRWPGYASGIVEDVINGQKVVIQWWKGWCPKFVGAFPGGFGAEVGVYRRIPGKARPASLPFLPNPLQSIVLNALSNLTDNDLWWPFPELGADIEYTLTNPVTGQRFFAAGPETTYWMAKWMEQSSYFNYAGFPWDSKAPTDPEDYILEFRINGKTYAPIPATSNLHLLSSNIDSVSRATDKLDVFVTSPMGMVLSAAWEPAFTDGWHGWGTIGTSRFLFNAPITAVSRSADKLDIFGTDLGGNVLTAAWQPTFNDGWHGWWQVAGGQSLPSAIVTAVSRSTDKLDVFVVGVNGVAITAAWDAAVSPNWRGWWPIGNAKFGAGGRIAAVSRSQDKLDIFGIDNNGAIQTAAWQPSFADGWHGWWQIAGGRATPGGAVGAVSRAPDKLDVFVVGLDGRVWTAAWDPAVSANWRGWWPIGSAIFPPGALIHAVSRSTDKLDIFGTDIGGLVLTASWQPAFADGWHGWSQVAGGRAAPGAPVSAVSRSKDKLDIFVVGTDGQPWSAAWEPDFASWHGWWAVA